jgi:hypothetical protein
MNASHIWHTRYTGLVSLGWLGLVVVILSQRTKESHIHIRIVARINTRILVMRISHDIIHVFEVSRTGLWRIARDLSLMRIANITTGLVQDRNIILRMVVRIQSHMQFIGITNDLIQPLQESHVLIWRLARSLSHMWHITGFWMALVSCALWFTMSSMVPHHLTNSTITNIKSIAS